jgi:hypothetical protein
MRFAILLAAGLALAGCGDSDPAPADDPTVTILADATGAELIAIDLGDAEPGDARSVTFRIANRGTADLAVHAVELTGEHRADFTLDGAAGCVGALAAGASCSVSLAFSPAALGVRTAALAIELDTRTQTVAITGTGVAPADGVKLTFLGGGLGEVRLRDAVTDEVLGTCAETCRVPVAIGTDLLLEAATPSELGGFAGACVAADRTCRFTVAEARPAVDVTFARDANEAWTRLLPGSEIFTIAYDAENNVVVGQASLLTKLSPIGATVWSLAIPVTSLATGPGSTVHVVSGDNLVQVSSAGAVTRTLALPAEAKGCPTYAQTVTGFRHCIAVAADGAVAVHGATGAARWDAAGTLTWSTAVQSNGMFGIAIDGSGNVLVAALGVSGEETDAVRFTSAGAALAPLDGVTSQYNSMFATTTAGALLASSAGHGHVDLDAPGFSRSINLDVPDSTPNGVAAAGTGDVAWIYHPVEPSGLRPADWILTRFTSTGTSPWSLTRRAIHTDLEDFGTLALDVAAAPDGHIAVGGSFDGVASHGAWIQTYSP